MQIGLRKENPHPRAVDAAPKIPSSTKFRCSWMVAKSDAERSALQLMLARLEYGRPFFLPPNVPAARVEALRRAFDATMKDPGYLAEADKLKLEVEPLSGEQVAALVEQVSRTPPETVAKVRAAMEHQVTLLCGATHAAAHSPLQWTALSLAAGSAISFLPATCPPHPEAIWIQRPLQAERSTSRAWRTIRWCAATDALRPTRDGRSNLCLFRALAARLRRHPLDRRRCRAGDARGACGAHRRRHGRDRQRVAASAARRPRRQKADHSAPPGARRSDRAACRRAVAMVVAQTLAAAQDAAERVAVDYEERTPAVDLRAAVRARRAASWPEAPGNIAVDWPGLAADPEANASEVERVIASAKHVARVAVVHQSIVVPRWSRAVSRQAMMRRATVTSCAAARKARGRCATGLLQSRRSQPAPARHHGRRRRRLRPQDRTIPGISRRSGPPPASSAGRCIGCRTAPRRS